MTEPAAMPSIEVATAEQQPILDNLFQLYAYDFSAFYDLDLGGDGRFSYPSLPLYWSDPARHPFLIWVGGKLAGFALVQRGSEVTGPQAVWDLVEFFVARGFRRRGVGTHAAHQVWKRFPGTWEVRVLQANVSAFHFWTRAIAMFKDEAVHPADLERDGDRWTIFSFESD